MATSDLFKNKNKNKNKNIIINFNNIKRFKSYSCDHREVVMFTTSLFLWLLVTCLLTKIKIKIKIL
jgi:flagella basal body P-ring formation protein FlgA